jgi:hypothetical protein
MEAQLLRASIGGKSWREIVAGRQVIVRNLLVVLWLCSVASGLAWLMVYDNTPGPTADAPASWPAGSALARDPSGPTLLMLAHPRCDCTRASIGELAELLARVRHRPRTFIVFIRPGGVEGAWENTPIWDQATRIPGVTVIRDDYGAEAQRFGVQTSGQSLLYNRHGRLLYSGGTTGARGKPGANIGRSTLVALLDGARSATATNPVFGCSLFSLLQRRESMPADADVD